MSPTTETTSPNLVKKPYFPELLSPAGSLDKLKVAISYGADAVYLAGQKFGLRTAADNFTIEELEEGIDFAHQRGRKVFVVLNGFLHDSDLTELPDFVSHLRRLKADAVIVSDLGVIRTVSKTAPYLPIHLSTQASCLNSSSGKAWKNMGVKRLILGRESSIEEAGHIKKITGLEVELFIHGSMCMAYSGHCTISNYTQGRDSNRGGCSQSCRFNYSLELKRSNDTSRLSDHACSSNKISTFLSSKDLMGIDLLPHFFDHDIDSLKIEGRMRSQLYAAEITKIYREAIDTTLPIWRTHGATETIKLIPHQTLEDWSEHLDLIPHREYTNASLNEKASSESIYLAEEQTPREEHLFLGVIRSIQKTTDRLDSIAEEAILETKAKWTHDNSLEVLPFTGDSIKVDSNQYIIRDILGRPLTEWKPNIVVRLPRLPGMEVGQIVRTVHMTKPNSVNNSTPINSTNSNANTGAGASV